MTKTEQGLSILYLTPYYYSKRGNSTTAKRMKTYLEKIGHRVHVHAFEEESAPIDEWMDWADVVHALHVRRTAEFVEEKGVNLHKPLVLTTGGTDINIDLKERFKKIQMERFLSKAGILAVFTEDSREKVLHDFPWMQERVVVIPQAVAVSYPEAGVTPSLPQGYPKLLLPAGLRPVKDVLYTVNALDTIKTVYPDLQLLLVGEKLEESVALQVEKEAAIRPWFHYKSPVDSGTMTSFYRWADVVLNSSVSEGQPISLLEGMALGVPALARQNPGNASVITPGVNGYLFASPEECTEKLYHLLEHPAQYKKMKAASAAYVQKYHHPEEEAGKYTDLYYSLLSH
ncbi:glycosyltransferase [Salibacterium aidingense]|uniref:glycosyltransferase n=1 Tax=Salibacterium aidingense TaxID=384933 RepID=UPI000478D3FE|nr:glycosyltransferase [Salibacterium aidingense]